MQIFELLFFAQTSLFASHMTLVGFF